MLTWGFFLSNFPRAARTVKPRWRVEEEEEQVFVQGEWRKRVDGVGVKEEVRISLEDFVEFELVFPQPEEGQDGWYTSFVEVAAVAEAAEIEAMEFFALKWD